MKKAIVTVGLLGLVWGCATPDYDGRLEANLVNRREQLVLYHTKYKHWKCQELILEKTNLQKTGKIIEKNNFQSLWNEYIGAEEALKTCHHRNNRLPSTSVIIKNQNNIRLINEDTVKEKNPFKE